MPTGSLATLVRFTYPFEAHLFKGLLESRGLAAFIADEHLITMQWMWEIALGGVKVQIMPNDLDAACEVLTDYQAHRLAESATQAEGPPPRSAVRFYGWRVLVTACWAVTGVVFPVPSSKVRT
ncbi:putative signal transducing protein [Kushneria sp. EE4]